MAAQNIIVDIAKQSILQLAGDGIRAINEVSNVFINNYQMRRNVKFTFKESIKGSFTDTKMYCNDILYGRTPRVMKQAVYFNKR